MAGGNSIKGPATQATRIHKPRADSACHHTIDELARIAFMALGREAPKGFCLLFVLTTIGSVLPTL